MVEDSAADPDGAAIDLVPHNLLVDDEGRLTFIDDEWRSTEWTADDVVARGLIWLCERLSTVPSVWQTRPSRRALLGELADLIGFAPGGDWAAAALRREAVLQVEVLRRGRGQEGYDAEVARTETELASLLEFPMSPLRPKLGPLIAERDAARAKVVTLTEEVVDTHAALASAHEELASIHRSLGFRLVLGLHNGVERIAPAGTRRRELYAKVGGGLRRRPSS
jgi:hypothetical protein